MARLARGEKVAEIADDWGVSPSTVSRLAARTRVALGARTNREAMVKYARNGYQPEEAEVTVNEGKVRDRLKAQREYLEVAGCSDV